MALTRADGDSAAGCCVAVVGTTASISVTSDESYGAVYGHAVGFAATVNPNILGVGTPTGSVQFLVDGSDFGQPVQLTGGQASVSAPLLAAGSHTLSVIYTSDNDAFTDSGGSLNQPVSTAPLTITASNADKTYGAVDPVFTVSGSGFLQAKRSPIWAAPHWPLRPTSRRAASTRSAATQLRPRA